MTWNHDKLIEFLDKSGLDRKVFIKLNLKRYFPMEEQEETESLIWDNGKN